MKFALLDLTAAMNMLILGATIRNEADYHDTVDGPDVLAAPVLYNRGTIAVVPQSVLDELNTSVENESDGIELRKLLFPGVPLHEYFVHNENQEALLFEVKARYVHELVKDLPVIFSVSREIERNLHADEPENANADGELDPRYTALYYASGISLAAEVQAEATEEEEDDSGTSVEDLRTDEEKEKAATDAEKFSELIEAVEEKVDAGVDSYTGMFYINANEDLTRKDLVARMRDAGVKFKHLEGAEVLGGRRYRAQFGDTKFYIEFTEEHAAFGFFDPARFERQYELFGNDTAEVSELDEESTHEILNALDATTADSLEDLTPSSEDIEVEEDEDTEEEDEDEEETDDDSDEDADEDSDDEDEDEEEDDA